MQRFFVSLVIVWLFAAAAVPAYTGEVRAQYGATVVRVVDGDTVVLVFQSPPPQLGEPDYRVRLVGVDTMESSPNAKLERDARRYGIPEAALLHWGMEAKRWMTIINDRQVIVTMPGRDREDRYKRPLVRIYVAGEDLNKRLVLEGLAVVTRAFEFEDKDSYLAAEDWAFAQRRGIWADPQFRRALRESVTSPEARQRPSGRGYPLPFR